MGRYYNVAVSGAPSSQSTSVPGGTIGSTSSGVTWTSLPGGTFDPNALLVEFDFFSFQNASAGTDGATITIHGVGLQNITQAQQFVGQSVIVKAGMSGGLPLEDPTQAGIILNGSIFQSWANWIGTEMDLNFLVYPSRYSYNTPGQFVLNWLQGTSLQSALTTTLKTAYPNLTLVFNLSQPYILGRNVQHVTTSLQGLTALITSTTSGPGFAGVTVSTPVNNAIVITDNLTTSTPKQIKFTDLIGQPTWIDNATIMVTTVMRADIQVGSHIMLPQGAGMGSVGTVTIAGASANPSLLNLKTAFQGQFIVQAIRQVGNSRDTGATAWVTMFQCTPVSISSIPTLGTITQTAS